VAECPEPVNDNKTLYERLQEQKQKKQDEWDEQHQLSMHLFGFHELTYIEVKKDRNV